MAYLTSRTPAPSVACGDLLHIVKTTDTSQNPAGSSYKATVSQLFQCCVNDFYVKNIHGCNTGDLFVQPLDEGNIYFGENTAEDGFTIDLDVGVKGRTRLGLHENNPQWTFDFYSEDARSRFYWYDTITATGFESLQLLAYSASSDLVHAFTIYGPATGISPGYDPNGRMGVSMGMRGLTNPDSAATPGYGEPGDVFIFAAGCSNNLNIINDLSTVCDSSVKNHIDFYPHCNVQTATSGPYVRIFGRPDGGSGQGFVGLFTTAPTERLDVNGNVRIRTVPSSSYSLSLGIAATGELRYQNTSDIRLKKDISTIESALTKVLNLRGVNFTWIDNEEVGTQIGFIAQEVEQVVPELTFEVPNPNEDYKGVHYENVSALLVEAVKELNEKTKLKEYTPTSISDPYGEKGDQVFDDNFMYIKTGAGWKKFPLMDI